MNRKKPQPPKPAKPSKAAKPWVNLSPVISARQSGLIDLNQPQETKDITVRELSDVLGRLFRYNGHSPVSVAQHSVMGALYALYDYEPHHGALPMAYLLHDTPEAFTGDITRPVRKYLDGTMGSINVSRRLETLEKNLRQTISMCLLDRELDDMAEHIEGIDRALMEYERQTYFPHLTAEQFGLNEQDVTRGEDVAYLFNGQSQNLPSFAKVFKHLLLAGLAPSNKDGQTIANLLYDILPPSRRPVCTMNYGGKLREYYDNPVAAASELLQKHSPMNGASALDAPTAGVSIPGTTRGH